MFRILFVCTGNTCRSPMAQALFIQRLQSSVYGEEFQVRSAGISTHDGLTASAEAIAVMREEEGIDLSSHRASLISNNLVGDADLILTMTNHQRDYLMQKYPDKAAIVHTLNQFTGNESGEIMDPYGLGLKVYRQSLSQIKILVDRLFDKILAHVQP